MNTFYIVFWTDKGNARNVEIKLENHLQHVDAVRVMAKRLNPKARVTGTFQPFGINLNGKRIATANVSLYPVR